MADLGLSVNIWGEKTFRNMKHDTIQNSPLLTNLNITPKSSPYISPTSAARVIPASRSYKSNVRLTAAGNGRFLASHNFFPHPCSYPHQVIQGYSGIALVQPKVLIAAHPAVKLKTVLIVHYPACITAGKQTQFQRAGLFVRQILTLPVGNQLERPLIANGPNSIQPSFPAGQFHLGLGGQRKCQKQYENQYCKKSEPVINTHRSCFYLKCMQK